MCSRSLVVGGVSIKIDPEELFARLHPECCERNVFLVFELWFRVEKSRKITFIECAVIEKVNHSYCRIVRLIWKQ